MILQVTPFSKYRIASISKVITAMAIEKLIEKKLLKSIDERVFGDRSILGTRYGKLVYNRFITNVTVKHLLEHTIGSWGNREKLEYERFVIFQLSVMTICFRKSYFLIVIRKKKRNFFLFVLYFSIHCI